jgi:hypothetical protein
MVFDLSHDIDQYWPVFERAFNPPPGSAAALTAYFRKRAPHERNGLIEQVRRTRKAWEASGWKEPPFPILPGAPGAGF